MKGFIAASLALACAGLGAAMPDAKAATSYNIKLPRVVVSADDHFFRGEDCPASYTTHQANGLSSLVVNIQSRAGLPIAASWSSPVPTLPAGGFIRATYYDAGCRPLPVVEESRKAGAWTLRPPINAKWVLIYTGGYADTTVRF